LIVEMLAFWPAGQSQIPQNNQQSLEKNERNVALCMFLDHQIRDNSAQALMLARGDRPRQGFEHAPIATSLRSPAPRQHSIDEAPVAVTSANDRRSEQVFGSGRIGVPGQKKLK
jgi:hypothetical protein